jgi:hypothetical protein
MRRTIVTTASSRAAWIKATVSVVNDGKHPTSAIIVAIGLDAAVYLQWADQTAEIARLLVRSDF